LRLKGRGADRAPSPSGDPSHPDPGTRWWADKEAGAGLENVVEITTFHIDLRCELLGFAKVKNELLPKDYPAWTAVGVTPLALPDLRVEIRDGRRRLREVGDASRQRAPDGSWEKVRGLYRA
jgi:hypothetical protein